MPPTPHRARTAAVAGIVITVATALVGFSDPPTVPPPARPDGTLGAVAAALGERSGVPVAVAPVLAARPCPPAAARAPFWAALEDVATRADARIVLHDHGRRVSLEPRGAAVIRAAVHGPFRTALRGVTGKLDADTGNPVWDVHLLAHWEPRVPVFRADATPTIRVAADDRGGTPVVAGGGGRSSAAECEHRMTIRLTGVAPGARRLARLAGDYTVTAADRMLALRFANPGGKPPSVTQDGVTAALTRFAHDPARKTWDARVELTYPDDHPEFQSFEAGLWLERNRARLVAPGTGKVVHPDRPGPPAPGQRVVATCTFREDPAAGLTPPLPAGWVLVYETPAPLAEVRVPFELTDIPLP